MEKDTPFVEGMRFSKPHSNAPDFIKGQISIKKADFIAWLNAQEEEEWINIDLKKSKQGNLYLQKNDWKKDTSSDNKEVNEELQSENPDEASLPEGF